jgi:hypothetical protein
MECKTTTVILGDPIRTLLDKNTNPHYVYIPNTLTYDHEVHDDHFDDIVHSSRIDRNVGRNVWLKERFKLACCRNASIIRILVESKPSLKFTYDERIIPSFRDTLHLDANTDVDDLMNQLKRGVRKHPDNGKNTDKKIRIVWDLDLDNQLSNSSKQSSVDSVTVITLGTNKTNVDEDVNTGLISAFIHRIDAVFTVDFITMQTSKVVKWAKLHYQNLLASIDQGKLRADYKKVYPNAHCVLSGYSIWELAHAKERSICQSLVERNDLQNVFTLSPNLHYAYDNYEIGITGNGTVHLASKLSPRRQTELQVEIKNWEIDVEYLHLNARYLDIHYAEFMRRQDSL